MLYSFMSSKVLRVLALIVVAFAVWKVNDGNVSNIVDSFINMIDYLSDQAIKIWEGLFN